MSSPNPVPPISVDKAKPEKLFYFVATGTVYRDGKCLLLQRSGKEIAHRGLWGVVGGKLEHRDMKNAPPTRVNGEVLDWEHMVEDLVRREAKEECGLDVADFRYLDSVVFRRPDGVPVVCVKFACKAGPGEVVIAPEFDAYAWVDGAEVDQYDCILGIPEEVRQTIGIFQGNSRT
ncbi:MAG: NUDIX domain-containing protein [Candidatus Kerfeldbacteria bacterium]|nr:NUDIX domain-containing protein [Candidatus Kerfeldbacteria bacterium]